MHDDIYLDLLRYVLDEGTLKSNRTGVDTLSVFGHQMIFNLERSFPILISKKVPWKSVVSELLWFLEGSNDERRLAEILYNDSRKNLKDKKTIWYDNAHSDYWKPIAKFEGDLGRVYGVQWRSWINKDGKVVDQVSNLLRSLKNDPNSRRHMLVAYNPGELDEMALPPCHSLVQFDVTDGKLSCQLYQRSCDMFLGVPFNISSYSLLTHILAKEVGLGVGEFIHTLGDAHIYVNHVDQVKEQLSRNLHNYPNSKLPQLKINQDKKLFKDNTHTEIEYTVDDFVLENYDPLSTIKAPMAV